MNGDVREDSSLAEALASARDRGELGEMSRPLAVAVMRISRRLVELHEELEAVADDLHAIVYYSAAPAGAAERFELLDGINTEAAAAEA